MSDKLWRPPKRNTQPKGDDESDDTPSPELFDAKKWRKDKHDASDDHLRNAQYPLFRPRQWSCPYSCPGVETPEETTTHSWNCPYWDNEGILETPF